MRVFPKRHQLLLLSIAMFLLTVNGSGLHGKKTNDENYWNTRKDTTLLQKRSLQAPLSVENQENLNQARNQWTWRNQGSMSIDYSYRFVTTITNNNNNGETLLPAVIVDVRDNIVTNVGPDGFAMVDGEVENLDPENYFTFDALFDLIQQSIQLETLDMASYHETYGYPTQISITATDSDKDTMNDGDTTTLYSIDEVTLYSILQQELDFHKGEWDALVVTDYDYEIQVTCFCFEDFVRPYRIQVRADEVVSVIDTVTGQESTTYFDSFPTVSDAFLAIQEGLDNFFASVVTSFDDTYHYPEFYSFDRNRLLADDEISYRFNFLNIRRFTPEQEALDDALLLWESHGLTRYSFGYRRICFCVPDYTAPFLVFVRDGAVIEIQRRDSRRQDILPEVAESIPTMEEIFATIQEAINLNAARVEVVYDMEYGYPSSMYIDYSELIADEEASISIDYLGPISTWQSNLDDARSLWEASGLEDYVYIYQRMCECLDDETEPKTVKVVGGVVSAVNGMPPSSGGPPTITGLFDLIQDAIGSNAFSIFVEYDPVYGYPRNVNVDYDELTADEELLVTAQLTDQDPMVEVTDAPTPSPRESIFRRPFCRGFLRNWFPRLCTMLGGR